MSCCLYCQCCWSFDFFTRVPSEKASKMKTTEGLTEKHGADFYHLQIPNQISGSLKCTLESDALLESPNTQDLKLNCGFEDLELQLKCFLLKTPEQEGQIIDLLCENPSAGGLVQKQSASPSPLRLGGLPWPPLCCNWRLHHEQRVQTPGGNWKEQEKDRFWSGGLGNPLRHEAFDVERERDRSFEREKLSAFWKQRLFKVSKALKSFESQVWSRHKGAARLFRRHHETRCHAKTSSPTSTSPRVRLPTLRPQMINTRGFSVPKHLLQTEPRGYSSKERRRTTQRERNEAACEELGSTFSK